MRPLIAAVLCSVCACRSGAVDESEPPPAAPAIVELAAKRSAGGDAVILNDALVASIRSRPEVAEVEPRLDVAFPAIGSVEIGGKRHHFEVVGDGIDPTVLAGEVPAFRDCEGRDDCPVPILVNPLVVEIYNSQHAPAHDLPTVDVDQVDAAALAKLTIALSIGESLTAGPSAPPDKRFTVAATVVGIHERATSVGMTVPIQYVRRWNARMTGAEAPRGYSTVRVTLRRPEAEPDFRAWAESVGLRVN